MLQKFIVNCYVPHTVNWALAAGVPRHLAVWAVSTLSCGTTACRLVVSLIADRKCVSRLIIFACGLLFAFLMCIPPLTFPGIVGTYISATLFGFHAGLLLTQLMLIITCHLTLYCSSVLLSAYPPILVTAASCSHGFGLLDHNS